jgi:peptidoglycan/LPS O-acetylase OafA/YrhL
LFIGNFIVQSDFSVLREVSRLYEVHIWAFPLGVFIGSVFFLKNKNYLFDKFRFIATYFQEVNLVVKIKKYKNDLLNIVKQLGEILLIIILLLLISYTAYHSGVGDLPEIEQATSLVTMGAIIFFFLIKKVEINLFHIFGFYSYEIYLLHWPILCHYDLFLRFLPSWLAIILYLFLFLFLGWLLKKVSRMIFLFLKKYVIINL